MCAIIKRASNLRSLHLPCVTVDDSNSSFHWELLVLTKLSSNSLEDIILEYRLETGHTSHDHLGWSQVDEALSVGKHPSLRSVTLCVGGCLQIAPVEQVLRTQMPGLVGRGILTVESLSKYHSRHSSEVMLE
jgi:hypothetical protein